MTATVNNAAEYREYRGTTLRLAFALMANSILIIGLSILQEPVEIILESLLTAPLAKMGVSIADTSFFISSTLSIIVYLFSFMFPVALFRLFNKGRKTEPMRLAVKLPGETPLIILAAIPVILACAYVNSFLMSPFDFSPLYESEPTDTALKLVFSFVSTALVPGFCEEFLFRGCVLSNLLPYGKTTAIVGSAVLFALMHGNPAQTFYTCAAGIALGLVYVETGSIWPGTFIHLFNNYNSVIQEFICDKYGEFGNTVCTWMDLSLFFIGAMAVVWLVIQKNGKVYSASPESSRPTRTVFLPSSRLFSGFFTPSMIVYFIMQIGEAGLIFLMVLSGSFN